MGLPPEGRARDGLARQRYATAFARVLTFVGLALLPAFMLFALFRVGVEPGYHHAVDFHTFWTAARQYARHDDPYPLRAGQLTWSNGVQRSFVYPPPLAAVLAPLTLLPYRVAVVFFLLLLIAATIVALGLLGVSDWRCFGAVFLWPPVLTSVSIGTISPLLLLGLAALWRWRDRPALAGLVGAAIVAAKLFMWPSLVWLVVTGRRGAATLASLTVIAACVVTWSWIDFAGLTTYPRLLHRITEVEAPNGYNFLWLAGGTPAIVAAAVIAVAASVWVTRKGDAASFAFTTFAALLLSPILWNHYLVLLAAAIAITRPEFGPAWLAPILLWLSPDQQAFHSALRLAVVGAVVLLVAYLTYVETHRQASSATALDRQAQPGRRHTFEVD